MNNEELDALEHELKASPRRPRDAQWYADTALAVGDEESIENPRRHRLVGELLERVTEHFGVSHGCTISVHDLYAELTTKYNDLRSALPLLEETSDD